METAVDIGEMITSSGDIQGGRPRVAGTGMTVMRIAGWYRLGLSAEEIAEQIGLTLAQVYAALAYYHANRIAVDADLDAEADLYDRLAEQQQLTGPRQNPQS